MNSSFHNPKKPGLSVSFFLLSLLLFLPLSLPGQEIESKVKVHTLANGMTFIFMERHEVPVFSAVYGFKVGSVDEVPGITGLAHLFEHMAFKGTPRIGTRDFEKEKEIMEKVNRLGAEISRELVKGDQADDEKIERLKKEMAELEKEQKKYIVKDEIDQIYSNAGGVGLNAGTGADVTSYLISLPSNRLELFCLMESERIKNAVLREFYTERGVVQEERKQTTEAIPMRQLYEVFLAAAFIAHPYGHPVVGWASDIHSVTLEEAAEFKSKYYTPNNCVVALVGDIYPEKAIPLIEKYFGDIPRGPEPPLLRTREPRQLGERRVKIAFDAEPQLLLGFHKPTYPHPHAYVMDVIASILTTGRTSRLYKDLVKIKQIAVNVNASGSFPGIRHDNLFMISATPRHPHTNEEVEKAIGEHLEKLKVEPVDPRELEKIKNQLEASYIRSLSSNFGMAFRLMREQLFFGDWKNMLKYKEEIIKVRPEDILEAAREYFTEENRTVAYLMRKQSEFKK
ncbi:MAG: M16 family metallopeptidase [Candidatus Aminicenantales bacterium]